ncbi:SET domain-containing protein [Coniophora puteana RWD-64-598 SS2]|uniref:SET domain-containing protein n=1 Tax=Coniophora puteana (strain RWD-64-598) TaxID=741705 RepID=A0A5M3MMM1_CONPW|nr:SET domain-containing protein [Coniophora puteana RWD-64-598 SS2]EIW80429.1 SET domain-containing protein [Coniophora puteana RWD-64-598 SS2]
MDIDDFSEGSRSFSSAVPPSTSATPGSPGTATPPPTLTFIDRTESRVFSRSGHIPRVANPAHSGYASDTTASQYDVDEDDEDDAVEETMEMKARNVLKQVRDEFYAWEPVASRATLRSLVPSEPRPLTEGEAEEMSDLLAALERGPTWAHLDSGSDMDDDADDDSPKVRVTRISSSGQERSRTVRCEVINVTAIEPHPPYESCTPSSRSIRMLEADKTTLRFIPYADQKDFPIRKVLNDKNWETWAWEGDFDPDHEMIQIEAARRLVSQYGLTINEIDNLKVFDKELRNPLFNNTGLLHDISQRDQLYWPGSFREQPHEHVLPESFAPGEEDEVARHKSVLSVQCPNPNCAGLLCHEHYYPYPGIIPIRRPKLTSQQLLQLPGRPCGDQCFRLVEDIIAYETINPDQPDDLQAHCEAILKQFPDSLPCDLVLLTDLPCREIYAQRLDVFRDDGIENEDDMINTRKRKHQKGEFKDRFEYKPSQPCAHSGPCTEETCSCAKAKLHCQLSCSCGVQCWRQRKGCKCPRGKNSCRTSKCACFKASRECMPGICGRCDAKGATSRPCRNTVVQRGEGKDIEIKRGTWGLGAFARQRIRRHEYLGDYTGVRMFTSEADRDEAVRNHTGLNYLFEFDVNGTTAEDGESIDAHRVGNFTRFLNHADDDGQNVDVRPMVVNGDPRIALFAQRDIKAGEELFLSYGEKYWTEGQDSNEDEDGRGGDADDEADRSHT